MAKQKYKIQYNSEIIYKSIFGHYYFESSINIFQIYMIVSFILIFDYQVYIYQTLDVQ